MPSVSYTTHSSCNIVRNPYDVTQRLKRKRGRRFFLLTRTQTYTRTHICTRNLRWKLYYLTFSTTNRKRRRKASAALAKEEAPTPKDFTLINFEFFSGLLLATKSLVLFRKLSFLVHTERRSGTAIVDQGQAVCRCGIVLLSVGPSEHKGAGRPQYTAHSPTPFETATECAEFNKTEEDLVHCTILSVLAHYQGYHHETMLRSI